MVCALPQWLVRRGDDTGPLARLISGPPISMTKERLIPLIVATALFMENMDSTVMPLASPEATFIQKN